MYLVDGGVYNNLPVNVFDENTYVIAVNTASQSYAKEQIKSFADITVQMVNILAAKSDSNSVTGWDLFIEPEMDDITNSDWLAYNRAIEIGYEEAYRLLQKSGFELRETEYSNQKAQLDMEQFTISEVALKGEYRLSSDFIKKELNLEIGEVFSWENIKNGMNRLYSLKLIRFLWIDFEKS